MRLVRLALLFALGFWLLLTPATANADIIYSTGNQQFTNVNIAADETALTIVGEVDATGVPVMFQGFGNPTSPPNPPFTQIELHGQHGVAFIEPANSTDTMFQMTISIPANTGFGFDAFDLKLDVVNGTGVGTVTFQAFDQFGNLIAPSVPGSETFSIDDTGQQPYTGIVINNEPPIQTLVLTSTLPLADLKQVSVELAPNGLPEIPEPASVTLLGLGTLGLLVHAAVSFRLRHWEDKPSRSGGGALKFKTPTPCGNTAGRFYFHFPTSGSLRCVPLSLAGSSSRQAQNHLPRIKANCSAIQLTESRNIKEIAGAKKRDTGAEDPSIWRFPCILCSSCDFY